MNCSKLNVVSLSFVLALAALESAEEKYRQKSFFNSPYVREIISLVVDSTRYNEQNSSAQVISLYTGWFALSICAKKSFPYSVWFWSPWRQQNYKLTSDLHIHRDIFVTSTCVNIVRAKKYFKKYILFILKINSFQRCPNWYFGHCFQEVTF